MSKVEEKTNIESWTIEVVYNCIKSTPSGEVEITMTIFPDHCVPFDLYWKKECKETSKKNVIIQNRPVTKCKYWNYTKRN
jgi:hypothetical protein